MDLKEKITKLLKFSVVLSPEDKKSWADLLPKMDQSQLETLYGVLAQEVRSWKKEGISIVPDLALEIQLLPEESHGSTLDALKDRLTAPPPPPKPAPQPEPEAEAPVSTGQGLDGSMHQEEEILTQAPAARFPDLAKHSWMVSDQVVAPKTNIAVKPKPAVAVPKVRNRIARSGLSDLGQIQSVDDLAKIEPAHLRQGPLSEQLAFIKQRIAQLAKKTGMLPVSIIPIFEQSPLFQIYLKAGAMLIDRNAGEDKAGLDEVMADMEVAGMDTLSQQEFEAVADLKKDLEAMAGV